MYFKCVGEDDLLGLQALELAPPALLEAGDRGGIYGYPFDRDVSDEMKVRIRANEGVRGQHLPTEKLTVWHSLALTAET